MSGQHLPPQLWPLSIHSTRDVVLGIVFKAALQANFLLGILSKNKQTRYSVMLLRLNVSLLILPNVNAQLFVIGS